MLSTSSVSSILGVGAPDPEVVPAHDELDIIFDIVKQLIFSHLIHSGYVDTAKSFHESLSLGKSSNGSVNISRSAWKKKLTVAADFTVGRNDNEISVAELEDAIILKAIYNMILSGDIDGAIEKIEKSYAGFLKNNKNIEFCLQCRRFVEIVYKFNESVANKQESREITPSISSENRDGAIPANGTPKIRNLPYRHCPDNVHPPSPAEREALRYIISSGREIYKKFMFEINPAVRSTLVV